MANPKRKLLRVLSAVYAVLLLLTLGLRVGVRAIEKWEKISRFTYAEEPESEYRKGVPIEEIDYRTIGVWYLVHSESAVGRFSPNLIQAPRNIRYYREENGTKILVQEIPEGTILYWRLYSDLGADYCQSYPTYEKGWRWVQPFLTMEDEQIPEDFVSDAFRDERKEVSERPYYYCRIEDLLAVEQAAYDQHERVRSYYRRLEDLEREHGVYNPLITLEDRLYSLVTSIDNDLYNRWVDGPDAGGAYCSPDIGPLVWRSEDTVYAVLLAVTAFLAIVVFRRKPERENEAGEQG